MSADHQNAQSPGPLAARSPRPRRQGALPPRPRADRAPSRACSNTSSADATSVCAGQRPYTRDRVPIICGSPARRRSDPHRSTPSTSKNHAMGVAARHRQTPAVTRSTFGVWRRARARGWRSDHSIDAPASASAAISATAMVMPRASVIFVAADSTRGAPAMGATATRTS